MKLSEYLKLKNLTHEKFAKMVGVTRPLITHIINQKRNPSVKLVLQIEKITEGMVKVEDLFCPDSPILKLQKRLNEKTKI